MEGVLRKFGQEYVDFLKQYPTLQKREDPIASVFDAVTRGGMTLAQADNRFGTGASEWWIRGMLVELLTFLGAMDSVTVYQVKAMAARIKQEYYYLTPAELTYFFYSFSLGDYGKLYGGRVVNPQDVLMGLRAYVGDVREKRMEVEEERKAERLQKQREADRKEAVSWEEFCRMSGREVTESPLVALQKKFCKESNRMDNE